MKPGFQSDSVVTRSSDGHTFVLVEPLVYVTALGAVITVPAGSTCDGASVPRVLWRALPPFGRYWLAAWLHDYLYRDTDMARINCDDLFKEAMISLGVDPLRAEAMYQGVRLGGQSAFDQNRARRLENRHGVKP